MNNVKKFLKSSIIFFIGNLFSRAISFLLLPIYTKNISAEDYGYYDLSITYLTIATSVLFFDIWASTMRFMFDKDDNDHKYKPILSGLTIFASSTFLYLIIGLIMSNFLDIKYLGLIMIYGISLNLQNMFSFIARGFEKNKEFAVSGILNTLIMTITSIVLIIGIKTDYSALYISGILGNIIQIIYLETKIKLKKNIKVKMFDKLLIKEMFKYTLPLCINSVSFWLLTGFNRIIISQIMTVADNGIYAIGNKFAVIITLITTCFTLAWQEMSFSRKIDDKSNSKFYSDACNLYIKFLGLGVIILIPVVYIVFPWLIDTSYAKAKSIIPLFLIATVVSAFSNFIGNIFYAQKDTKHIFISSCVSSILNVILSYPLIKLLGLNGASLAMLLSFTVNILIRYFILKKSISIKINLKNIIIIIIFIVVSYYIYNINLLMNLIWLFTIILLVLYILKNYIPKILPIRRIKND